MFYVRVFSILCLCVTVGYGKILVLVNRVAFLVYEETNIPENTLKTSSEYHYADGDLVDISCLNLDGNRTVALKYHLSQDKHFNYGMPKPGNGGIGIHSILQRVHNNTNISCEYFGYQKNAAINITLILQETFYDDFYLNINEFIWRHGSKKNKGYALFYLENETLKFEFQRKRKDVILETLMFLKGSEYIETTNETKLSIRPHKYDFLKFMTRNYSYNILWTIETHFKQLPTDLIDNTLLKLNTSSNHTLINLYSYNGSQLIYYEYQNGDILTLNCSTTTKCVPGENGYYLSFKDTKEKSQNYIIKHMQLSTNDDKTTIACRLLYSLDNLTGFQIRRQILVVLYMKTDWNTIFGDNQDFQYWIPAAVVGVILIVVVATCTTVYYMKKRNHRRQAGNTNEGDIMDQQNENYDSIELCPAEMKALYAVPMRHRHDNTASNNKQHRDLSESQVEQSSPELNYAVLDMQQPGRAFEKPSDIGESTYAEVNHNVSAYYQANAPHRKKAK